MQGIFLIAVALRTTKENDPMIAAIDPNACTHAAQSDLPSSWLKPVATSAVIMVNASST